MTAMKPCNDISWSSGALEIFKNSAFGHSLGAHIECIPHIVRRKRRRVETFQIVGETFFSHPGNLARTEKCLKGFMISAHCTLLHGVQANQAHRPSHHMRTTNKQQILAEFLRCAHVYKHQDQLRQNVWCVNPHPLFYLPHNCLIHKGYQESQQKYQETAGCNWTVFLDETQFLIIS